MPSSTIIGGISPQKLDSSSQIPSSNALASTRSISERAACETDTASVVISSDVKIRSGTISSKEEVMDLSRSRFRVNPSWILPKMAFFFVNFMQTSYIPFLNIFFESVGLHPTRAGIITGIRLVGMLLGSPFWGAVADRTGKHRRVILFLCTASIALMLPQPWIASYLQEEPKLCADSMSPTTAKNALNGTASPGSLCATDNNTLFGVLLAINLVMCFCDGSLLGFVDNMVMRKIQQTPYKVDYGWQRFFGAIGDGLGSFVTGLIAAELPATMSISSFSVAFFTYSFGASGLAVSTFFLLRGINFKIDDEIDAMVKKQKVNVGKILIKTVSQLHVVFFLLTVLVVGVAHGLNMGFLFLRLEEIHTNKLMMGLNITVGAAMQAIMFPFTSKIIKFVGGPMAAMGISSFSYFLRFIVYSYLTVPWTSLLVQSVHGISFALFIAAAVHQTKLISPKDISSTMYGLMNGTHFGFGMLIGNVFGGMIFERWRGALLFRGAAVVFAVWSAACLAYVWCERRRSFQEKDPAQGGDEVKGGDEDVVA